MNRLTRWNDETESAELKNWDKDYWREFMYSLDPVDSMELSTAVEKLAEYEDAEEQGLLLRLPCKVGDKVYTACSWGVESGIVGSIEFVQDRIFVNNVHGSMIGEAHNIFLTTEEAEQALRERKANG